MPDKIDISKIKIDVPQTAAQLKALIERQIEEGIQETIGRKIAQEKRQTTVGIRAGGAPASRAEAADAIDWILRSRRAIEETGARWTAAEQRAAVEAHLEATRVFNERFEGARVAILFRSGGPFVYTSSFPTDYTNLVEAGSKGKWVWQRGWGPNRSPSYSLISIDPRKVLHDAPVASSWLLHVWLVEA